MLSGPWWSTWSTKHHAPTIRRRRFSIRRRTPVLADRHLTPGQQFPYRLGADPATPAAGRQRGCHV
jgi:hypothetical protein